MDSLSQQAFFIHLEANNCTVMKVTKFGYFKTRNNKTGKVIGIQPLDTYLASTICCYCRDLRIPPPNNLAMVHHFIESSADKMKDGETANLPN